MDNASNAQYFLKRVRWFCFKTIIVSKQNKIKLNPSHKRFASGSKKLIFHFFLLLIFLLHMKVNRDGYIFSLQ